MAISIGINGFGRIINGQKIPVFTEGDAASIPWGSCGAEYIIDATGPLRLSLSSSFSEGQDEWYFLIVFQLQTSQSLI